ncbi:uncharacterized protein LOC131210661 [Anopheles bellator]|uniref:uncharacterized protein LOC131210661 n=1 Tax=Anopheles bellator TaxID=139047 RepID=UPI00264A0A59|nr:uncharacterized protein LOC131210661 [Anopheles bellator]
MLFHKLANVVLGSRAAIVRGLSDYHRWTNVKTLQQTVDPYTKIQIDCAYELKIVPYDLLDCPDSNLLKATVKADGDTDAFELKVSEKLITITNNPNSKGVQCILEIPIKADLEIHNNGNTAIADLYSDEIEIVGTGNIDTKNLRSTTVRLDSTAGNISCRGITLAQQVVALAAGKGSIFLDKLQGGTVSATTQAGNITVNACYSNQSSFQTQLGDMDLKSIHKDCTVTSAGGQNLVMNGFYGTLQANIGSRNITLQLSEIVGKSSIQAPSAELLQLNLAETVYETACITVNAPKVDLDASLDDKVPKRNAAGVTLGKAGTGNMLHVETNGSVTMQKMSWADSFSFISKMEH